MNSSAIKKVSHYILSGMFLVFIFSSSLFTLVTEKNSWSEAENRGLALLPEFPDRLEQITPFFRSMDTYIQDHLSFRDFYIYRYQRELDKRFNQAGPRSTVISGLDGWYFFNAFNMKDDFLGRTPLKEGTIASWLASQNKKYQWLLERNIRYLYIVAPNKQSIYPEYLMKHAMAVKGTSRFEELLKYTKGNLPEYMLNLHDYLQPQLFDKPLYYKNDSHWNIFGAYLVFTKTIEKLSSWHPTEKFTTDFEFGHEETGVGGNIGKGGDLVQMLMRPDLTETYPQLKPFASCGTVEEIPTELSNIKQLPGRISFVRKCPTKNLRAVVFRDSFFVSVEPFLSENFKEVIYLWKEYDQQNVEEVLTLFRPDIVIEARAERHIFDSFLEKEKRDSQQQSERQH